MYNYNFGKIINKTDRVHHWLLEIKRQIAIKFKGKVFMGATRIEKIRELPNSQFRLDFNFQKEGSYFSLQEEKEIIKIAFSIVDRELIKYSNKLRI